MIALRILTWNIAPPHFVELGSGTDSLERRRAPHGAHREGSPDWKRGLPVFGGHAEPYGRGARERQSGLVRATDLGPELRRLCPLASDLGGIGVGCARWGFHEQSGAPSPEGERPDQPRGLSPECELERCFGLLADRVGPALQ